MLFDVHIIPAAAYEEEPIIHPVGVWALELNEDQAILFIAEATSVEENLTHVDIVRFILSGLYSPPKSRFVLKVTWFKYAHFPNIPAAFIVGER